MTGKMEAKARRVRCPKCLSVLSEPSDVMLYVCGGCGAKLQAKKRNNNTVDTTSQRPDNDSSRKELKVDRDFVDQEADCSSNQHSSLNSNDELNQNSDYNDLHGSNRDQDAAKKAENGKVEVPPSDVEDYSSDILKIKQLSGNQEPCCSSNKQLLVNSSDEPDQIIHNDPRSSTELSSHEDPESSPEATAHNRIHQEQKQKQNQEQNQKEGQSHYQQSMLYSTDESDHIIDYNDLHSPNRNQDASKRAENGTVDAPPSVVKDYSLENFTIKLLSDDQEPCCSSNQQLPVDSNNESYQNIHKIPHRSTEFSGHGYPESSPEDAAHKKTDQEQNQKQDQSHYQNAGKQQESIAVVGLEHSSGKQKIKQLSDDNETGSSLTHQLLVNSMSDHNDHRSSSDLSYHDDTESSPETTIHNTVKKLHETEFISCRNKTGNEENSSESEEAIGNARIISDSDGGSKSNFRTMIAKKLPDTRQKKPVYLDEDDLLSEDGSADLHHRRRLGGTRSYDYEGSVSSFDGNDDRNPRKNHIRSVRDEHVDSGHRYRLNRRKDEHRSRDVQSFYGSNEFHNNRRHSSPIISENLKLERLKLLKLVRELEDQLERRNVSNLQHVPSYYNHVLNNLGRYDRRMAFSGEATVVNRQRDAGSCHHCYPQPQGRHFSAQLHSHHVCYNGPDYGANPYRSPHFSSPSSPKPNCSESNYSATDDHWQMNHVRKPFNSPKKKQYVRPIAGGSPWITCYLCSKLLQLPQSFLLFNKRYHSLRCGGCMKVLSFTLSNRTHISRYYPEETIVAPPSSEVEDFDKVSESWVGPVSCSDRSFEKSYSTETDRNRSREFGDERRKTTVSRDPSGSTQPPSSKVSGRKTTTSEIEEVEHGPNGSPLHWLMGYASPSKVIRG